MTKDEISAEQFLASGARTQRRSKYGNQFTEVDGVVFQSAAEARRSAELRLLSQAGAIEGLVLQPRFPLEVNGHKIGTYVADFLYYDNERQEKIIEDVKSKPTMTPVYRIKKKLMLALHGIEITETS